MMKHACIVLLLAASACSKPDTAKPEAEAAAPPPTENTFKITASAPAASSAPMASASATATATATTPPPAVTKAAAAAAATTKASAALSPPAPLQSATTHISGRNFTLDVSSPGCRVDTPCVVTLQIAAVGDYHVNKEYPYKFIAAPAAGVAYLGNGDANTFSRAAGDFHEDSEKTGTMTVRLKPSATGSANVSGTYKMSICSAEQCQIEAAAVTLAVPVI